MCLASWSRLYWSFSRADMLPLHSWTSRLSGSDQLPVNAIIVNTILADALAALSIGSTTAMNAILGAIKLCGVISYTMAPVLLLLKGRDHLDPNRWLNLGRLGPPLDVVAMVWCTFVSVWLCFPTSLPVSPTSLNYAAPILGGFTLIMTVYWYVFTGKGKKAE